MTSPDTRAEEMVYCLADCYPYCNPTEGCKMPKANDPEQAEVTQAAGKHYRIWHDDQCVRAQRGKVHTTPEDCDCGADALEARLNAALEASSIAERERDRAEGGIEKLVNLVDGHQWLAEGRGPYADTDGHYDEEVQRFVQSLLDALPNDRWQPWQQVLTKLEAAEQALAQVRAKAALADEAARLFPSVYVEAVRRVNGLNVCKLCNAQTRDRTYPQDEHHHGCVMVDAADWIAAYDQIGDTLPPKPVEEGR